MTKVCVSVPAKVMLAGEYAVLDGARALAATLAARLRIKVALRGASGASVTSNLWREPREISTTSDVQDSRDAEPLLDAVCHAMRRYGIGGANVEVDSDVEVAHGIGSSSALRLGVMLAMAELKGACRLPEERWAAARAAYELQRDAQGRASGYDVATQLTGGLVRFSRGDDEWPGEARQIPALSALARIARIFVGGRGASTREQIAAVNAWLTNARRMELRRLSDELVYAFEAALSSAEALPSLIASVVAHRAFFSSAPHFPARLVAALTSVHGFDETFTVKTTGAGGEDALLLIGDVSPAAKSVLSRLGWRPLGFGFDAGGARIDRGDA